MDSKLQEDKGGGEDGADPPKTSPVRPGPGRGQKLRTWREIARLGWGRGGGGGWKGRWLFLFCY